MRFWVNPSAFYLVMQLTMLFALSRPVTPTIATRRAVLWMIPATLVLPFATTLHPRDVIDDPALMLSFLGVATAATTIARSYGVAQLFHVVASTRVGSWGLRFLDRFGVGFDVSIPELGHASPGAISRPRGLS